MSISKKRRFEVFKRDGFKCAYCGASPPSTILEVDHIEPKSGGGKNDINNLVTACFGCNRGKSNTSLSKVPPTVAENLKNLKEREEQIKEYRKYIKRAATRENRDIKKISTIYERYFGNQTLTDRFRITSLKLFLSRLPIHEVEEAMHLAIDRCPTSKSRAKSYFCGICWQKIRRAQGEV